MSRTALVLFAGFLAYLLLGCVAMFVWQRRMRRPLTVNVLTGSDAWRLGNWLPQLIAGEVYALVGAGVLAFLLFINSPLATRPDGAVFELGAIMAVVGCAVMFAAYDVLCVVSARHRMRRLHEATQTSTSGPDAGAPLT